MAKRSGKGSEERVDGPEAFRAAFGVSRETAERLTLYAALLGQWSKVQDLVAPGTLTEIWSRHFADSAQLLALIPEEARVLVDLGTGAGFPGLVIAILAAERGGAGLEVHLVESNGRKCAFLRDVARQTGAFVEIHATRIENVASQRIVSAADVVTARALAPLDRLLGLAEPLMGAQALGLFAKGRDFASEIESAGRSWAFELTAHISRTDPDSRILAVRRPVRR